MDNQPVEILLVEDNPGDVELTLRAFQEHRFSNKVHVAKDGAEAPDFIFCKGAYANREYCEKPKVILLDLHLPKIDGLEVLRRIKTDERTKVIPVVVLSTSKEEPDLTKAYQLGVNSYVVKPVEFEEFVHAISQLGLYWLLLNKPPCL